MVPLALLAIAYLQTPTTSSLTICIDPGHPSEVGRGTTGKKISEIKVAWEVAQKLERILLGKHVRVVLTKKSEMEFVRNADRSRIANDCHANLFIRLHCDSSAGTGYATYYPDRQGTVNGFTGPEPSLLAQVGPIAKRFHKELSKNLGNYLKDNGLKSDIETAVGSKQGALTGSIYSHVPVVLLEMCVLTNRKDEEKVSSQSGQMRIAQAIADAALKSLTDE